MFIQQVKISFKLNKTILLAVAIVVFLGCGQPRTIDGARILSESIAYHDPSNSWNKTVLKIHIQEPRTLNPHRYSLLELNNSDSTFRLERNRGEHISEHIIDKEGNSSVLMNGKVVTDTALINKYRLDPSRNTGYREFYQVFYGLPMSLKDRILEINNVSETKFNGQECYKLEVELKEPMFSKAWSLFLSKSTKEVIGLEIVSEDEPGEGERLYFENTMTINEIRIPRIRHWHELSDDSYSGTDIIIVELTN